MNGNGRAADNLPVAVLVPKAWNDRVEPVPARFVGRIGKIIEQVRAFDGRDRHAGRIDRSEAHTSELQSLMRISYAVFCLKTKQTNTYTQSTETTETTQHKNTD